MAINNSADHQVGDTIPNSQIITTGQKSGLPMISDLDANNIDCNDKAGIKTDLDSAHVNAPETQGSSLPKLTQVIITNVPPLKHNSKDPETWALRVKFALAQLRLQHLINSSVPRPAKGQHNFNRWAKWSRTVASWLYLQVDEDIQDELQRLRKIPSKVDDLFDKIMDVVREGDKAVNATVKVRNYDSRKLRQSKEIWPSDCEEVHCGTPNSVPLAWFESAARLFFALANYIFRSIVAFTVNWYFQMSLPPNPVILSSIIMVSAREIFATAYRTLSMWINRSNAWSTSDIIYWVWIKERMFSKINCDSAVTFYQISSFLHSIISSNLESRRRIHRPKIINERIQFVFSCKPCLSSK